MKPQHIALALLVAVIWGVNFTVVTIALGSFPPLLLAALRFAIAALPALFLPRPKVPWPRFLALGATLFLGQFGLLFIGMAIGLPPGLASVTLQSQVFLTILIAAVVLHERPTSRQICGTIVAFTGLIVIASTAGAAGFTYAGLGLALASAICWSIGNVLLRGTGKHDMFSLMVWLSVIPPLPFFGMSLLLNGPATVMHALLTVSWISGGAVLYNAVLSTLVGYGIWGQLLKHYPAATVAPFSLLVPIFGVAAASLILGETFDAHRIVGMLLVFSGLMFVVLPLRRWFFVWQRS